MRREKIFKKFNIYKYKLLILINQERWFYMAKAENEYKMFKGCVIGNRIPFIEVYARKVFDKLWIKTSDSAFACCPDPVGLKSTDHESWLAMAARNLTIA